jgi:hypothetical protein
MTILDTLAIARGLRDAGFDEKQAEALTNAVRQASGIPDISHLATKADLDNLRIATKADLAAGLAELKADLQRWTISLILPALGINAVIVLGAMYGLAKLLGH